MMANAMIGVNTDSAFGVHGANGMYEVSISSRTHVVEMRRGEMRHFMISPEDFGMASARIETILGGDAIENARIIESVLGGQPGPRRDVVLLNSTLAIVAGGAAETRKEELQLAAEAIDSGGA